ncbi:MAG: Wzz/FepE/Etk N-terminal domain-containing protein [Myxococcota bacterium]
MSGEAYFDEGGDEAGALPGFVLDPIGVLRRRWLPMLLVILIGTAASVAYVQTRKPEYQARATVLVASQRISQQLITSTVETNQLEKVSAILGELYSRRTLSELIEEHDLFPTDPAAEGKPLTLEEKAALVRGKILIAPDRSNAANQDSRSSATVFEVLFTYSDPVKAAAVATDLASRFTDIHLRDRSRQARITTEFLRRELRKNEEELAAQERAITNFKQANRGSLPSELGPAQGRLDRLQSQRQSLALQIASVESRLATLASTGSDIEPDSAEAQIRSLRARYKEQRMLYTDDHPNVVSLANQIDKLEAQIAAEPAIAGMRPTGSPVADAARIELAELRRQLSAASAEIERLEAQVLLVPQHAEELAALEQRAQILRENHIEFLRKVNQAELSEAVESAQQGERASILDPAVPPWEATSSPLKVVALLLIGTFGLAGGLAILLELIDAVIVSESEIERHYRLPVLGSASKMA